MVNVSEFKVEKAPATVYYIPNFVTNEEEEHLLNKIYKVPKPKWTQLKNRRLQNWGGVPHPKGMLVEHIPEWLSLYLHKVWELGVFEESFKPNHVLVNEYLAGQGIMPHSDGPIFYPTITTLSLGSHTLLDFYCPRMDDIEDSSDIKQTKLLSLLIEPRSLLILQDDMYCKYLHGIEEKKVDIVSHSGIPNWYACDTVKSGEKYRNIKDVNMSQPKGNVYGEGLMDNKFGDEEVSGYQDNIISNEGFVQDGYKKCAEPCNSGSNELSPFKKYQSSTMGEEIDQESVCKLERGTRVSLTMRNVPKTSKVKLKFGR